jgi:hypothetical protein
MTKKKVPPGDDPGDTEHDHAADVVVDEDVDVELLLLLAQCVSELFVTVTPDAVVLVLVPEESAPLRA